MQSKAPQIRCQFTNHFSIPKKKMGAHTFIQFNNCGSLQLGFKYRKYYEKSTNHAIETLPQNGSVEALHDLCKQAINFVVVEGKKTAKWKHATNSSINTKWKCYWLAWIRIHGYPKSIPFRYIISIFDGFSVTFHIETWQPKRSQPQNRWICCFNEEFQDKQSNDANRCFAYLVERWRPHKYSNAISQH